MKTVLEGGQVVYGVHDESKCYSNICTIHKRTEHHMRGWKQNWREDRGIMERICEHGIGHPDPDDLKCRVDRWEMVHGCDGCCAPPTKTSKFTPDGGVDSETHWRPIREFYADKVIELGCGCCVVRGEKCGHF